MSLTELMAPVWAELKSLSRRVPSVSPATVTSVNPIRIQVDGQTAPVAASPDTLVPVGPGDRVRVLRYGTTHLILGRVNSAGVPYATAAMRVTITGTGGQSASAQFPLPPGRFSLTPIVVAMAENSAFNAYVWPGGTSASQVQIGVRTIAQENFSSSVTVHVHAIQMTPTSAEG